MPATVTIRDETVTGQHVGELTLDLLTETLTVRELIRSRVYQEVQDFQRNASDTFKGLVQPEGARPHLEGYRLARPRDIDWKQQYEKACDAFERNAFFVLVNDRQAESLDEQLTLTPTSTVAFVKLVPLVGG